MKLSEAIRKYKDSITDKKSVRTVYNYLNSLSKLLDFVGEIEVREITEELINHKFKKFLSEEVHLNKISSLYILQNCRYFFEYLSKQNIKSLDPEKLVDKALINKSRPNSRNYKGDIITDDEAQQLLNYWKNSTESNNPRGIRNQLIMSILWDTGVTISELEMLTREDVNWESSTLILIYKDPKKQSKNRNAKISPDTIVLLKKYFNTRQDNCQALIVAFDSWNPYIVSAWPLSSRGIQRVVHRPVGDLKINKKISPSVFRSTRYTQLIRQGLPLSEINRLIGVSGSSRQYLKFTEKHRPIIPSGFVSVKEGAKEFHITSSGLMHYLIKHSIPMKKIWKENYFDKQLCIAERNKKGLISENFKAD